MPDTVMPLALTNESMVYMYCPMGYTGIIANSPTNTQYGCVPGMLVSVKREDELFLMGKGFVPGSPMSAGEASLSTTGSGAVVLQSGAVLSNLPAPSAPGDAATKGYADSLVFSAGSGIPEAPVDGPIYGRGGAAWAPVLPIIGGQLEGPLLAFEDPTQETEVATKHYVDNVDNMKVNDFGDIMTGPLVLYGDPEAPLEGATKHYVDTVAATLYPSSNPSSFVTAEGAAAAAPVQAVANRGGDVVLTHSDITDWALVLAGYYPTSNPNNYQTAAQVTNALGPYALSSSVPLGASTLPVMAGAANAGLANTWARADHVHPTDTSRYAANNPSNFQTAAQVTASLGPYALTSSVPLGSSILPTMAGSAAIGGSATWARADHVHPIDTSRMPVVGVTNGADAPAGTIGEYVAAQILSTAPIALTTAADKGIVALALSAGDWDVWGACGFTLTGNNSNTTIKGWINIAGAAVAPSLDQMGGQSAISVANTMSTVILPLTPIRVLISAPGSVQLGTTCTFSSSIGAWGRVMARRRR